jgi:DNA-3-methyladenine glycosylase II
MSALIVEATAELAARDARLALAVERHGPCRLGRRPRGQTHFEALARVICAQQLAGSAARAIHGRFVARFDGTPTPEAVLACDVTELRALGLSGSKAASLQDLAGKIVSGDLRLASIGRRADDEVIAELTQVRGIGRWSAEMFLLFRLGRIDVWPVDDYGVRKGASRIFELETLPSKTELDKMGQPFRPYRAIVAWYCWRAADEKALTVD